MLCRISGTGDRRDFTLNNNLNKDIFFLASKQAHMGTTQVKEKAKEMDGFTFNAQALQIDNYIKTLAANLKEHIHQNFTQHNMQGNWNVELNFKDKSVEKHCNEDFIAGYATSEHLVKLLQDACKQT
jgi:hypothetical protein